MICSRHWLSDAVSWDVSYIAVMFCPLSHYYMCVSPLFLWFLASPYLPPAVVREMNLRACHSAIRFGEVLDHTQCVSLVQQVLCYRNSVAKYFIMLEVSRFVFVLTVIRLSFSV